MTRDDQEAETERLSALLAEANRTIHSQERRISKLAAAAVEVIKWAEWSGTNYSIDRKPIDDLRAALEYRK